MSLCPLPICTFSRLLICPQSHDQIGSHPLVKNFSHLNTPPPLNFFFFVVGGGGGGPVGSRRGVLILVLQNYNMFYYPHCLRDSLSPVCDIKKKYYLAEPGKATGCSINAVVIHSLKQDDLPNFFSKRSYV